MELDPSRTITDYDPSRAALREAIGRGLDAVDALGMDDRDAAIDAVEAELRDLDRGWF